MMWVRERTRERLRDRRADERSATCERPTGLGSTFLPSNFTPFRVCDPACCVHLELLLGHDTHFTVDADVAGSAATSMFLHWGTSEYGLQAAATESGATSRVFTSAQHPSAGAPCPGPCTGHMPTDRPAARIRGAWSAAVFDWIAQRLGRLVSDQPLEIARRAHAHPEARTRHEAECEVRAHLRRGLLEWDREASAVG